MAWNQYDIFKASPYRPSRGLSAEAPDQSLAFYLNGQIDNGSSSSTTTLGDGQAVALPGMVVVDTTTQEARNISTGVDKSVSSRAGGGMVYIPSYGVHGILVALGGLSASEGQATKSTLTDTASFVSMSDILVYDINGYYDGYDGWYWQQATGDLPAPRTDTCLVVASTADNSSHSIYMYGGRAAGDITFDDVYVLSIPTFTWIKVYGPGQSPRYGHTCDVVGSQMVTVGGLVKSPACDWETKGVAIFEMSTVNWTSQYTPRSPPYVLPSVVAAKVMQ